MKTGAIVLYVDDERPNRVVFEHSFKDAFAIHCVASAEEALAYLSERAAGVAVLVTDQRMPGMTGNELLETVKERYPTIVRVVITAYNDLDPILRAVNEGLVARYIVKPWRRAELEQVLRWAQEAYTLGRQNSALQLRLMQTERLVTLGSIGAAVIHDINQPLSYMITNGQRLRELASALPALRTLLGAHGAALGPGDARRLADLAEELGPIIDDMQAGCEVIQTLTGSIRRLLRPPAADAPKAMTDPVPVIRYALSVCQEIAIKAGGTLLYDGPSHLPPVCINATELTQLVINVVANAAQALARRSSPGGRVVVRAAAEGTRVRFTVTDDGAGMSPEVLTRVGEPFFSTRPDGTGLGVAQCRRLVEREGGELAIQSTEGVGTMVTFSLPAEAP
ncbi:MAG TPA: hybrid sensor histidine kinase/response regulator [Myxococcota bacterium]|nr:hybrid sensor histidine kinase/response regulator [Myxococcota bacterium]